jgi:hypothetical protein
MRSLCASVGVWTGLHAGLVQTGFPEFMEQYFVRVFELAVDRISQFSRGGRGARSACARD